jgi:cell fate regulator YaaT (PSP1 superfamily)
MYEVVQVRLREAGKIEYFSVPGCKVGPGECVIVEMDRGLEYGEVVSEAEKVLDKELSKPLLKILRKATPGDLYQIDKNKKRIEDIIATCEKKIKEHKLTMKLIDAEYSFVRALVPFKAEPLQIIHDPAYIVLPGALDVGILYPQYERTFVRAREEPVK